MAAVDVVSPLVGALADTGPDVVTRLLHEHARQPDGRCAVCTAGPQGGRVLHPCPLASLAYAAQAEILRRRRAS